MDIMGLLAFSLPIIIFLFWGTVGYATLSLLRTQRNIMQNILLAPTIGLILTLLPTFWLSRLGVPVENTCITLTFVLSLGSICLLWWKKPVFPFKHYLSFIGIFLLALILVGRPLLTFGFNWLSFSNADIGFYCLAAVRLLHHGFSVIPDSQSILAGSDYSLFWWFLHVPFMHRCGSEFLLAWLSGLTTLTPVEIYMPLILALHLTLISAAGGMIYQAKKWRSAALGTCFLLACSALTALGTAYQLMAQVGGLALLITASTLILQPFRIHKKYLSIHLSILIAITVCALLIYYPEVSPFLFLGFLLYFTVSLFKNWLPTRAFWVTIFLCVCLGLVILNTYWLNVFCFTLKATLSQAGDISFKQAQLANLFPYFLIPSGIANLIGWQAISVFPKEPWLTISIIASDLFLLLLMCMTLRLLVQRCVPAFITLVMFVLGIFLFCHGSGFGIFKLAMYIQPFLLGVLAISIFSFFRQRTIAYLVIALFAISNLPAQQYYIQRSKGAPGSFVELTNASQSHLLHELRLISQQLPVAPFAMDTSSTVAAQILAVYLYNKPSTFYSNVFFDNARKLYLDNHLLKKFDPNMFAAANALDEKLNSLATKREFSVLDPLHPNVKSSFVTPIAKLTNDMNLIMSSPLREIFNRRQLIASNTNFLVKPVKDISNYLIFVNSSLGQHYLNFYANRKDLALNNLEMDFFSPTQTMAGVGRYLLFQVVNPTNKIRLELTMTSTLNGDNSNLLPKAAVIGAKRNAFNMIGHGSARVFSEVITPQLIANTPYVMIDLGNTGKRFSNQRDGIMNIYGSDILLDHRVLTGFARDVSAISEDDYHSLIAPSNVSHFPNDLYNPDLEYSGIYEDGWISDQAYFMLTQPKDNTSLIIKGLFPQIENKIESTTLNVYVDNQLIIAKKITPGSFMIELTIPQTQVRRKIELHFSKTLTLPEDTRPVAGKIDYIGFRQ